MLKVLMMEEGKLFRFPTNLYNKLYGGAEGYSVERFASRQIRFATFELLMAKGRCLGAKPPTCRLLSFDARGHLDQKVHMAGLVAEMNVAQHNAAHKRGEVPPVVLEDKDRFIAAGSRWTPDPLLLERMYQIVKGEDLAPDCQLAQS